MAFCYVRNAPVVQWIEHQFCKLEKVRSDSDLGSIPSGGISHITKLLLDNTLPYLLNPVYYIYATYVA